MGSNLTIPSMSIDGKESRAGRTEGAISRRTFLQAAGTATALGAAGMKGARAAEGDEGVELRDQKTVLDIRSGGKAFATYNYNSAHAGLYRPYFNPVMGPTGKAITQEGEFPGTLRGHYWHRGLFVAHQKVNGVSYWEERQADCGRMVHLSFERMDAGGFFQRLAWRDVQSRDVIQERREASFEVRPDGEKIISLVLRLEAAESDVTFEKTPYNLLACRVINAMCRTSEKQKYMREWKEWVDFSPIEEGGKIINSEGQVDDACRGARARWCDFSGPQGDGTWAGVTLLEHPGNPRHPTAWHNWNNMTITASFTYHEPYLLKRGAMLSLGYRVYVHRGRAEGAKIESEWKKYAGTKLE